MHTNTLYFWFWVMCTVLILSICGMIYSCDLETKKMDLECVRLGGVPSKLIGVPTCDTRSK